MNMTDCECENIDAKGFCVDYIISLGVISSAFIVSEILPFLKSHKGNGLVDLIICCFEGSECCLSKVLTCLKKDEEYKKGGQKQQQTQSIQSQEEQKLTNSVNINITK